MQPQDNSKTQRELIAEQEKKKQEMITLYASQHQHWLQSTMTISAIRLLEKHRELFVKSIEEHSGIPTVSDATIRHLAINLRNTTAIIELLTNTEKFSTKLSTLN